MTDSTGDPNSIGAIPFYKSPQQIGLIATAVSAFIALFPKIGQMLNLSTPSDVSTAITNIFSVIALVAPIVGGFMRAKSSVQPLTLNQTRADNHPATVALTTKTSSVLTPKTDGGAQ